MSSSNKASAAILTATIGILSLTVGAVEPADRSPAPERTAAAVQPAQTLALPAGFKVKDVNADGGVRSGLVKLTERAVDKGDFNRLLAELSKQDKERAREFKGVDQAKLDGIIGQIQTQWKAKYGQDFKISDKNLIFSTQFPIVQGEVSDPAVAIDNWPVPAISGDTATAGNHAAAKDLKKEEKLAKLTAGRNVALIRFPMSHGLPAMDVSMLHQLPGFWRVDVPNNRTGEQIYTDLSAHLTYIRDHQDQWPADAADAYRMVAHHTVAALYGVPLPALTR